MLETQLPPAQPPQSVLAPEVHTLSHGVASYADYERLRATARQISWNGEDGGRFDGPDGMVLPTEEARQVLNTADHPERLILGDDQTDQLLEASRRLGGHNSLDGLDAEGQQAVDTVAAMAKGWGVEHPEDLTPDDLSGLAASRVSLSERLRAEQPRNANLPELAVSRPAEDTARSVGGSAVHAAAEQTMELPQYAPGAADTSDAEPQPDAVEAAATLAEDLTADISGEDASAVGPEDVSLLASIAPGAELDHDEIARRERRDTRRAARAEFWNRRWGSLRELALGLKNLPADILNSPEALMSFAASKVILKNAGTNALRAGGATAHGIHVAGTKTVHGVVGAGKGIAQAARWTAQTYHRGEQFRADAEKAVRATAIGATALYLDWLRSQQPRR